MPYVVIPRKYRPLDFDSIEGQDHVVRILKQSIDTGRISHAYLFSGPRGVGKTTTARVLAKALNCESSDKPTSSPCGKCRNCVEIKEGRSLDVIEIDGASNRGVDQIRDIIENVKYAPVNSRYKVYIIDEVHMLTREAFNALLRTLEEPPEHVVFIFATTEPHKVIETILSRCQRYDFRRLSVATIVKTLKSIAEKEGVNIKESDLYAIARKSNGGLRDAEVMLDQLIVYSGDENITISDVLGILDFDVLREIFLAVKGGDEKQIVEILDKLIFEGYTVDEISSEFIYFLRNLLYVKIGLLSFLKERMDEETLGKLQELSLDVSSDYIEMIIKSLMKFQTELRITPDPHLLFEITLLRLSHIDDLINILSLSSKGEISIKKKEIINSEFSDNSVETNDNDIKKNKKILTHARWFEDPSLTPTIRTILKSSTIEDNGDEIVIIADSAMVADMLKDGMDSIKKVLKKEKKRDVYVKIVVNNRGDEIKDMVSLKEEVIKEMNPQIEKFMKKFDLYIEGGNNYDGHE